MQTTTVKLNKIAGKKNLNFSAEYWIKNHTTYIGLLVAGTMFKLNGATYLIKSAMQPEKRVIALNIGTGKKESFYNRTLVTYF